MLPLPNNPKNEHLATFHLRASKKFDEGQAQHGGSIYDKDLAGETYNEIIDLVFYVSALKDELALVKELAYEARRELSLAGTVEPPQLSELIKITSKWK